MRASHFVISEDVDKKNLKKKTQILIHKQTNKKYNPTTYIKIHVFVCILVNTHIPNLITYTSFEIIWLYIYIFQAVCRYRVHVTCEIFGGRI